MAVIDPADYDKISSTPEPAGGSFWKETAKAIPRILGSAIETTGSTMQGAVTASEGATGRPFGQGIYATQTSPAGIRKFGQQLREKYAISPEFQKAHPVTSWVGSQTEQVLPTMAALAVAPEVAVPGMALESYQRGYETGKEHGLSDEAAHKGALADAAITGVGMGLMGPVARGAEKLVSPAIEAAGAVVKPGFKELAKRFAVGTAADTGMMQAQALATGEAEKAMGVRPEAEPVKETLGNLEAWAGSALGAALFRGVGSVKNLSSIAGMRRALENPDVPPAQRMAVAGHIENLIRQSNPEAADKFKAHAEDAILGETPRAVALDKSYLHDNITNTILDEIVNKPAEPTGYVAPFGRATSEELPAPKGTPSPSIMENVVRTGEAGVPTPTDVDLLARQTGKLDTGGQFIIPEQGDIMNRINELSSKTIQEPGDADTLATLRNQLRQSVLESDRKNIVAAGIEALKERKSKINTPKEIEDAGLAILHPDVSEYLALPGAKEPSRIIPGTDYNVREKVNATDEGVVGEGEEVQLPGAGKVNEGEGAYREQPAASEQGGGTEANGGNRPEPSPPLSKEITLQNGKRITVEPTQENPNLGIMRDVENHRIYLVDANDGHPLAAATLDSTGKIKKIINNFESETAAGRKEERNTAKNLFKKALEPGEAQLQVELPDGMEIKNKVDYLGVRRGGSMGPNDEQLVVVGKNGKDAGRLWLTKVDGGFEVRKVEVEKDQQRKGIAEALYQEAVDKYGIWKGSTAQSEQGKAFVDSMRLKHPEWFGKEKTFASGHPELFRGLSRVTGDAADFSSKIKEFTGQDVEFKELSAPNEPVVNALSEALGKKVVYLAQTKGKTFQANGVVFKNDPNTIYTIKSGSPKQFLTGTVLHEATHMMERDAPELYSAMVDAVKPFVKNLASWGEKYNAGREKAGLKTLGELDVQREFIADVMHDNGRSPQFWDKVIQKAPNAFKRFFDMISDFITRIKEGLTGTKNQGRGTEEYITDLEKVRDTMAGSLAEYMHLVEAKNGQEYASSWSPDKMAAQMERPQAAQLQVSPKSIVDDLKKDPFIAKDVVPRLTQTVTSISKVGDQFLRTIAPGRRSEDATQTQNEFRTVLGKMWRKQYQAAAGLDKVLQDLKGESSTISSILDTMRSQGKTLADNYFARKTPEDNWDFMFRMDKGVEQPDAVRSAVAKFMKDQFDARVEAIQHLRTGLLENVDVHGEEGNPYFPRYWKEPQEEAQKAIFTQLSRRPLQGRMAFAKERIFDDIYEGMQAGFTLTSNNPVDLFFMKINELDKYIAAHTMLQNLETEGVAELFEHHLPLPKGMTNILGVFGTVKRQQEDGSWKSYKYGVREDVAQVINNYLSPSLYNNPHVGAAFTGYMNAANQLNQFQLGVGSFFHAGFTSIETVVSEAALGIKALASGDLVKAGKYFLRAPAAFISNPKTGDAILQAYADPTRANNANIRNMPLILEGLEMAGAKKSMDTRFITSTTENMFSAWSEGNKVGAAARAPFAAVEQLARPVMEWLVPRQKFGVFGEMYNYWLDEHPNAPYEQRRVAANEIWNRVDSRLGQVGYDRLFLNNTAKNLLQAIIRAPGWTGGTILELGGGFKDLVPFVNDIMHGRKPTMTNRTAYLLGLVAVTMTTNGILTKLFTGEDPEGNDYIAFRTGNTDEHGFPERYMLPTYMKDMYAYWNEGIPTTLSNKVHPMLGMVKDVAANKDYYGTEIRHEGDNVAEQFGELLGFTVKQYVPFWMRGWQKETERGGSAAAHALPLIGVMPAPSEMNRTEAEKLARKFMRERAPSMTKTSVEFDRSRLISKLTRDLRNGVAGADEAIRTAVANGEISTQAARNIQNEAELTPLEAGFRRLSLDEATKIFEVATDEEKAALEPLLKLKQARWAKMYPHGEANASK